MFLFTSVLVSKTDGQLQKNISSLESAISAGNVKRMHAILISLEHEAENLSKNASGMETLAKCRDYLSKNEKKVLAMDEGQKVLTHMNEVLDKLAPAAPREEGPAQKKVPTKKKDGFTKAPAKQEDILSLQRKIFDAYVSGKPPAQGDLNSLADRMDSLPYANFLSVLNGGVLEHRDGSKTFFLSDFDQFRSFLNTVEHVSSSSGNRIGVVFHFGTAEHADDFLAAVQNMTCINITEADRKSMDEKRKERDPTQVPLTFQYKVPDEYREFEKEHAFVEPSPRTTTQKTGPIKLTRSNIYEARFSRAIVPPKQKEEEALRGAFREYSSSGQFEVNYNSAQQLVYARHFKPDDPLSRSMVSGLAQDQLGRFLSEKGLSMGDLGTMKEGDKAALQKEMLIRGSATLESTAQWENNHKLATLRGQMLAEEVAKLMFAPELSSLKGKAKDAQLAKYVSNFKIESDVVSPWHTSELANLDPAITQDSASRVLNSIMGRLQRNEGEFAVDTGSNFQNSRFLFTLLTGRYPEAISLVNEATFPKAEKDELVRFVRSVEKDSKGKPAISESDGRFVVSNLALAQKLWVTQADGDLGLRFEVAQDENRKNGQELSIQELNTAKERMGAYFVSVLEQGFSRSASLLRSTKGALDIQLEGYYEGSAVAGDMKKFRDSPPANFKDGATYTAVVSVGYRIGKENAAFDTERTENPDIVYAYVNSDQYEAKFLGQREDGRYEYAFTFRAAQYMRPTSLSPLSIESFAHKVYGEDNSNRFSSGSVYAPMAPMPGMRDAPAYQPTHQREIRPLQQVTTVNRVTFTHQVETPIPSRFGFSAQFPGYDTLDDVMGNVYGAVGGSFNYASGFFEIGSLSGVSGENLVKYFTALRSGVETWLAATDPTEKRPVRDIVMENMKGNSQQERQDNFNRFKEAFQNGRFQEAVGYLLPGEMFNALGSAAQSSTNFTTMLTQEHIASLMINSFSGGTGVSFDLESVLGSKSATLNVYLQRDMTFLVTNQTLNKTVTGAELMATYDLGSDILVTPSADVTGVISSAKPSYQIKLGTTVELPVAEFLALQMGAHLNRVLSPGLAPFTMSRANIGARVKLNDSFRIDADYSRLFSPIAPVDQISASAYYKWGPANIGLTGGQSLTRNLLGKYPWFVGGSITFDL